MDMSSVDAPSGFEPYGPVLRANLYSVVTAVAAAVARGTLMETAGTTYATPKYGALLGANPEETGAAGSLLGACLATYDYKGDPCKYIAADTVGNGTIAGYALIADHPQQLYIAQEDGDTSSIQAANVGLSVEAIGTGIDTNTGRSTQEIDSNTVAGTATLAFRLVAIHPDDTISSAGAAGNHARFIVQMNTSFYSNDSAGA